MESKIPSFRDAKPHESWELVPLDELCKAEAIFVCIKIALLLCSSQ